MDILDFYNQYKTDSPRNNLLVNVRGCNGAGKSTIPLSMIEDDPNTYEVTWFKNGKERPVATVIPKYNFIALGHYRTKCGGLDTFKSTDDVKDALEVFWGTNWNILMEGILSSTVYGTYADLFNTRQEVGPERSIIILNLLPPLESCLERIQARNGGKPIKEDLVEGKW